MLKIKFTALNIVIASIFAHIYISNFVIEGPSFPSEQASNVVELRGEVNSESMKILTSEFLKKDREGETIVKITSPGGEVFSGRELTIAMSNAEHKIITYAPNYFMSMGMAIFLEGKERLISKDSIGMIHRGSSGGVPYHDLKKLAEAIPSSEAASDVKLMDMLFETEFKKLEEIKKVAPDPELTQYIIDKMKEGKEDLFLNADELIRSGIATKIVKGL